MYPASIWGATLASAPAGVRAEIAAAAHAAGLEIVLPSETAPALAWQVDEVGGVAAPLPDATPEAATQARATGEDRSGLDASHTPAGTPQGPFRRTVRLGDESLELSLEGRTEAAQVRVFRDMPAPGSTAAGAEGAPYTPVELEGTLLWIAGNLVQEGEPGMVRVRLSLSGSEEADLVRIDAVRDVLLRFPGPHHAAIEMHYATRSRLLPTEHGVDWSADLRAALTTLVGAAAVTFRRAEEA
jgi:hypothetical protein